MRITVGQLRRIIREAVESPSNVVVWNHGGYTISTEQWARYFDQNDGVGEFIFETYQRYIRGLGRPELRNVTLMDDGRDEIDNAELLPGFIKMFNSPSKGTIDAPLRAAFNAFVDRLRGSELEEGLFGYAINSADTAYKSERQARIMGGDQRGPRQVEALRRRR